MSLLDALGVGPMRRVVLATRLPDGLMPSNTLLGVLLAKSADGADTLATTLVKRAFVRLCCGHEHVHFLLGGVVAPLVFCRESRCDHLPCSWCGEPRG